MNITLMKDGEEKTYSQFFVSSKFMRMALELRKDMNLSNLSVKDLDTVVNFVVEVFGEKFTSDDVYDGLEYDKMISTIFDDIFMLILQGRKQKIVDEKGNEKKEH